MWNDKETEIDLLGHEKLAQTVIEMIQDNHLRPLTIGIYGDWGVGKSSILSILQQKIKHITEHKLAKTHCIVFNGWLFQGFEDAKSALMETIVAELASIQPKHRKVQKLAKSLIRRVNWLKVAKVGASTAVSALTGIPDPGMLGGLIGLINKGKEVIGDKVPEIKDDDEGSFLKEYEEETITGQIRAFRKEFAELIKTSKVDHIIVLVDDLDRCLPKSVIETLEAIRLFLFVEGTTFVISADERMIEYAVREHFPNLPASYSDYTKSYLEKLIQIPIRIPLLNRLQTGNYIKLLLLQEYLKHDYDKLIEVYNHFDRQKKTPYDPIELSYEVITTALGSANESLNEAILVGGHLTPILSSGLKGNPRNIKRFLNTLFLRLRVARIYGLQDVIKLNVLAKLMLLERFHPDKYSAIVEEVSTTPNGLSETIGAVENEKAEVNDGTDKGSKQKTAHSNEEKVKADFEMWAKIEPSLSKTNLHPYIFISREKAIGFDSEIEMAAHLQEILGKLSSGSNIALQQAEKALESISFAEASELFKTLENESRAIADVKTEPNTIKGLFRIIAKHPDLEERLVNLVSSYPTQSLGAWAISQFIGLRTQPAIDAFNNFLTSCSQQTENKPLNALAEQQLKK